MSGRTLVRDVGTRIMPEEQQEGSQKNNDEDSDTQAIFRLLCIASKLAHTLHGIA